MSQSSPEGGFTLVELLVAVSVASVMFAIIFGFQRDLINQYNLLVNRNQLLAATKDATLQVATAIRSSKSLLANNAVADSHAPSAPGNLYSWSSTPGNDAAIVLAIPAVDQSGNLIYVDGSHQSTYTNNVIYYLDQTQHILYKRVLANTQAPGNVAVTSCPPTATTPSCPADAKIVADVASFAATFYDSGNNTVTVPSGTEAIQITVSQTKYYHALSYSSSFTTRATLRNK